MKAVSFAFDDFDLVVPPFQFAGVDGVITVIEIEVKALTDSIAHF